MLAAVVVTAVESRIMAPVVIALNCMKSKVWPIATVRWYKNANSIVGIGYQL